METSSEEQLNKVKVHGYWVTCNRKEVRGGLDYLSDLDSDEARVLFHGARTLGNAPFRAHGHRFTLSKQTDGYLLEEG